MKTSTSVRAEALTHGFARGVAACIEPLSFWGGYDAPAGKIIEPSHPSCGQSLAGKILLMARAKGSSSSSSVLAEAIRNDTGPAGIVLAERDLIIAIGVIVANELYAKEVPLVVVSQHDFARLWACSGVMQIDAQSGASSAGIRAESC